MGLDPVDCQIFEVKCLRHSLKLARNHAALQPALNRAIHLSSMVKKSAALDLGIGHVASYDLAGVLWDQGDMMASIQILRQLRDTPEDGKQAITVSRPTLLADMVSGRNTMQRELMVCRVVISQTLDWRGLTR